MGSNLFGIGFGELLFLAILALVIFGPKRIPEIARTVGHFLREVRRQTDGLEREVRQWMADVEPPPLWAGSALRRSAGPQVRSSPPTDAPSPQPKAGSDEQPEEMDGPPEEAVPPPDSEAARPPSSLAG